MAEHRIYKMSFASIYPHYVTKVTKKEQNVEDLNTVIKWLTGYNSEELQQTIKDEITLEEFFNSTKSFLA